MKRILVVVPCSASALPCLVSGQASARGTAPSKARSEEQEVSALERAWPRRRSCRHSSRGSNATSPTPSSETPARKADRGCRDGRKRGSPLSLPRRRGGCRRTDIDEFKTQRFSMATDVVGPDPEEGVGLRQGGAGGGRRASRRGKAVADRLEKKKKEEWWVKKGAKDQLPRKTALQHG